MKIAITGHSAGFGEAIATKFVEHGHEIIGFSLPEYDITNHGHRLSIMASASSADAFINCAYNRQTHDTSQSHLFTLMYGVWKDVPKHIVNIGSIAPTSSASKFIRDAAEYRASKASLDAVSDELSLLRNKCRVTNIRPDWMISDELRRLEAEYGRKAPNPMRYEDVARIIYQIIELGDVLTVTSISLKGSIQ